jgi:hypothetical protein
MIRLYSLSALLIALQLPALASPPAFEFLTRKDLATNSFATTAVVSADFNLDGIPDLAIAGSDGVSMFLGLGEGRFGAPSTIHILEGSNPYSDLAVADINVDGIPDLVLFDGSHIGLTLFGQGDGTFTVGPQFSEPATNAFNQVFTADFNRDGKPDLALGSELGINILLGNGDGTFSAPTLLPVNGNRCIAVGDVNGDGNPDAIACGFNVKVFLGNGNGTFQNPVQSATPGQPVYLTVGDLNGDGKLDLVGVASNDTGSNPNLGPVYVLFGNGDGTFQPTVQVHSDIGPLSAAAIGDVNGDGLPDIVALGQLGLVATILNAGAGTFDLGSVYPVTFGATYQDTVRLADLKGDDKLDIVTSNSGGYFFSILFNQGDGTYKDLVSVPVLNAAGGAGISDTNLTPLAQADFNGDGRDDFAFLVGQQKGTAGFDVYLGTGKAGQPFVKGSHTELPYGANSITTGDFNNDGRPDIAICFCTSGSGTLAIYLGNGDATFDFKGTTAVTSGEYMVVSDFNNDGYADIALSSGYLLPGNGDGTFASELRFYADNNAGLGDWLAAADFNNDGKMDIAFFPPEDGFLPVLSVFLGNGDGTFQTPAQYTVGGDPVWGDIADFNEDGIPDIVIWNSGGGGIKPQDAAAILLGVGDGTFSPPTYVQGEKMTFPNMLIARDLNGDGHVDLAVLAGGDYGGYLGGNTSVFLFAGNGDGTFGKQQQVPGAQGMSAIASGYFHGSPAKGYPDLVTFDSVPNSFYPVSSSISAISVLLNKGAAH